MEASQNIRVRRAVLQLPLFHFRLGSDLECNGSGPRLYGDCSKSVLSCFLARLYAKCIPLLAEEGWLRHQSEVAKPQKSRRRGGQSGEFLEAARYRACASLGLALSRLRFARARAIALALRSGSRFAPSSAGGMRLLRIGGKSTLLDDLSHSPSTVAALPRCELGEFLWVFLPCRWRSGTQRPFSPKNGQHLPQTSNPCIHVPEWTRNATDEFLPNEWQ